MPRAGLGSASVTEAGAALADEVGLDQLTMGLLAQRLGVKTPSLYKHVDNLADLVHRIAVLAMVEPVTGWRRSITRIERLPSARVSAASAPEMPPPTMITS